MSVRQDYHATIIDPFKFTGSINAAVIGNYIPAESEIEIHLLSPIIASSDPVCLQFSYATLLQVTIYMHLQKTLNGARTKETLVKHGMARTALNDNSKMGRWNYIQLFHNQPDIKFYQMELELTAFVTEEAAKNLSDRVGTPLFLVGSIQVVNDGKCRAAW